MLDGTHNGIYGSPGQTAQTPQMQELPPQSRCPPR